MLFIVGMISLIGAFLMKIWPPKEINDWYGYRTPLSKSSEQAWCLAQKHNTKALFKYGLIMMFIGLLTGYPIFTDTYFPSWFLIDLLVTPLFTILMIFSTHKYLKKKLNK